MATHPALDRHLLRAVRQAACSACLLAVLSAAVMVLLWHQQKPIADGGSGQTRHLAAHEADGPALGRELVPSRVGPRVQARIKQSRPLDLHAALAVISAAIGAPPPDGPAEHAAPARIASPLSDRLLRGPPTRA